MDATVPLPRDLHPIVNGNGEETDTSRTSASTSALASSVVTQSALHFHTGESTVSPASQNNGGTMDGETTLVVPVADTPPVAQTSALTPLRVSDLMNQDDLQTAHTGGARDAQSNVPLSATAERSVVDSDDEQTIIRDSLTWNRAGGEEGVAIRQSRAKGWRWWLVASTCVATIAAGLTLAALTYMYSRQLATPLAEASQSVAIEAPEARSESLRLMAEAERLLAAGSIEAAISQLREAVRLDDRNARAQLQLGAALERTGKRSEAIVFYEAASALAPNEPQAWQQLAEAQFAEKRFAEAAQSYRRFFDLVGSSGVSRANDALRLRYAEALRLIGESEQPHLAQVAASESAAGEETDAGKNAPPIGSPEPNSVVRNPTDAEPATPTTPPDSSIARARDANKDAARKDSPETGLPPQERFERAVRLYATDRQAALKEFESVATRVPDAHYYLGLARTEGRPLQTVHRAILLQALKHFQTAQKAGGRHSAQAKRLADQLGREYDRRRREGNG